MFYLHTTPLALYFLYFILKPGLTKLQRASLGRGRERERERERGRQGERERERERGRAEAGREPGSFGLHLPKYWDYKRAPPRPAASALFFPTHAECIYVVCLNIC